MRCLLTPQYLSYSDFTEQEDHYLSSLCLLKRQIVFINSVQDKFQVFLEVVCGMEALMGSACLSRDEPTTQSTPSVTPRKAEDLADFCKTLETIRASGERFEDGILCASVCSTYVAVALCYDSLLILSQFIQWFTGIFAGHSRLHAATSSRSAQPQGRSREGVVESTLGGQ